MNKVRLYLEESWAELFQKVSWPTWAELQSSAMIVMVASFIIAIVIFVMDISFSGLMGVFYQMFS